MTDKPVDVELLNTFALAIVKQAIDDWHYLCKGGKERYDCNFRELTQFFKHECEQYLTGTDVSAEKIYEMLKQERSRARKKVLAG